MTDLLKNIDEAWAHFTTNVLANLREYEKTGLIDGRMAADDGAIVAFMRLNPGVFEARLLAALPELGATTEANKISDLTRLMAVEPPSDHTEYVRNCMFGASWANFDPLAGINLCAHVNWQYPSPLTNFDSRSNFGLLLQHFINRAKRTLDKRFAASDFPPEVYDSLVNQGAMSDILRGDLEGMDPEDIESVIQSYTGASIEAVEAKLHPDKDPESGFLAVGERLGQVIWNDAKKLRELGVDRHALARRMDDLFKAAAEGLERALPRPPAGRHESDEESELRRQEFRRVFRGYVHEAESPFQVTTVTYSGCGAASPFHTIGLTGSAKFTIRNRELGMEPVLQSETKIMTTIRRLCFFKGNVATRIDPETAARVLGFIK